MTGLAASWLFQKPSSPIFASSSLRRFCFVGRSKRVPDGDHPGRKRFDRGGEVFVNHGLTLGSEGENANGGSILFGIFEHRNADAFGRRRGGGKLNNGD